MWEQKVSTQAPQPPPSAFKTPDQPKSWQAKSDYTHRPDPHLVQITEVSGATLVYTSRGSGCLVSFSEKSHIAIACTTVNQTVSRKPHGHFIADCADGFVKTFSLKVASP